MSNNQVVVITGASSGIGRATAIRFAKQHARLVLGSRRQRSLDELVDELNEIGAQAIAVPTDVTNEEAVTELANTAVENFGRIDVWVNNAAVSVFAPFTTMPLDDFRRVIDVNIMGYVYGARAALEVMSRQKKGVIINVASLVGEIPQPYTAPYGMSKAAIRSLGVSLRSELMLKRLKGVSVATVLPPTIDTPFFRHSANYTGREVVAMPPVYPADQVAKAIVRLAAAPKPELVIGRAGQALVRQHRRTPALVEAQMAMQTDKAHLSRQHRSGDTTGTLYAPAPAEDAEVSGGWNGESRTARRRAFTWVLLVAGGAVVASRVMKAQSGSARMAALANWATIANLAALADRVTLADWSALADRAKKNLTGSKDTASRGKSRGRLSLGSSSRGESRRSGASHAKSSNGRSRDRSNWIPAAVALAAVAKANSGKANSGNANSGNGKTAKANRAKLQVA
jgi:short-subunit dehydrogenase